VGDLEDRGTGAASGSIVLEFNLSYTCSARRGTALTHTTPRSPCLCLRVGNPGVEEFDSGGTGSCKRGGESGIDEIDGTCL
jgi:hypothetical protein